MKTILIVEDDPLTAKVYANLLANAGYATEIASDGPAGLQRYQELLPDAVLLDVMLPGLNGIEVLAAIRAVEAEGRVPIIVVSNADIPQFSQGARSAGATTFFCKSKVTPFELVDAFRAAALSEGNVKSST